MSEKTRSETMLLKIARAQRNAIAQSVRDAAVEAGLTRKGDKPKLSELRELTQTLGKMAKNAAERQAAVDRLAQPGKRFIPDWEAMETIKRLDKTYYRRWSEDTLAGDDRQGYVGGNIQAGDLALIVEYARSQLIEHGGMKASQTESPSGNYNPEMGKAAFAYLASFGPEHAKVPPGFSFEALWKTMQANHNPIPGPEAATANQNHDALVEWWGHLQNDYQKYASGDPTVPFSSFRQTLAEFMEAAEAANLGGLHTTASPESQTAPATLSPDQRTAIQHAMDVLSSHGDSTTSAGAMVVLDGLLENGTSPTPDFEAIEGKRMGELTPEQQEDAYELWLRNQSGWFKEKEALEFLFKRLDQAREGAPQAKVDANQQAEQTNTAAQQDQDTLNQWLDGEDHDDTLAPR